MFKKALAYSNFRHSVNTTLDLCGKLLPWKWPTFSLLRFIHTADFALRFRHAVFLFICHDPENAVAWKIEVFCIFGAQGKVVENAVKSTVWMHLNRRYFEDSVRALLRCVSFWCFITEFPRIFWIFPYYSGFFQNYLDFFRIIWIFSIFFWNFSRTVWMFPELSVLFPEFSGFFQNFLDFFQNCLELSGLSPVFYIDFFQP